MAKRKPPSKVATIPAPIGGWNARDPMPAMEKTDAVILDNWIPSTGGVELRTGFIKTASGLGDTVETLMEYRTPGGVGKLFAAAGQYIFNVTGGGVINPLTDFDLSGLSNARWSSALFETSGGHFMLACNGQDNTRIYNGTVWADASISGTGVNSSDLISVNVHASRLWFVQKNSLNVWYLGASSIAGTLNKFPLGAVAKLGGQLMVMASWTRDGGAGPDDVAVFITSAGEAILYSGIDPNSAATWNLVGVFRIPEPIGRRCIMKSGADVGVITSQGALALSTILPITAAGQAYKAVTDKIRGAFAAAYQASGTLNGWQIIEYPKRGLVIINVPQSGGVTSHQYVMYVATGAWCRFKDLNGLCFSMYGDDLYFGTDEGNVYRLTSDYDDDGAAISATVLPAFSDFGLSGNKRFLMAKPQFTAVDGTSPPVELRTNYQTNPITTFSSNIPDAGSSWDEEFWDEASWGPATNSFAEWQMLEGIGRTGSFVLSVASRNPILLNETDILFEPGGVL